VRDDIHAYFGLSYANYLVLNRTLLEAMPEEWQLRFVTMLEEYGEAWQHEDTADGYNVETGYWTMPEELDTQTRKLIGLTSSLDVWVAETSDEDYTDEEYDEQALREVFIDRDGNEVHSRVFVPTPEKIDHYRRPRRYTP
jgi:hypothetical protein